MFVCIKLKLYQCVLIYCPGVVNSVLHRMTDRTAWFGQIVADVCSECIYHSMNKNSTQLYYDVLYRNERNKNVNYHKYDKLNTCRQLYF